MRRKATMTLAGAVALALTVVIAGCAVSERPSREDSDKGTGLPAEIAKSGVLRLGTDPSYPPCEFVKPGSTTIIGFEPDLWNALGEELGVKVEVTSTQFAGLIPGVEAQRFDVAMECISDTPEREKRVTFVDYMYGAGGVVTLEDNPAGVSDDPLSLCGLRTAYQTGTVYGGWIKDILNPNCEKADREPIASKELPGVGEIQLALRSGRIDFVLADAAAAAYESEQSEVRLALFTPEILPRVYMGIVVRKQDDALANALLEGLQQVFASGEYHKILKKWNVEDLALDAPGINLQASDPLPGVS